MPTALLKDLVSAEQEDVLELLKLDLDSQDSQDENGAAETPTSELDDQIPPAKAPKLEPNGTEVLKGKDRH